MSFNGFPIATIEFLLELADNNNREWFHENKKRYEKELKEPAFKFIETMGEVLSKERPNIQAIPKVNKSFFRLNRDTRFSKNKDPYKTHIGILMWEGNRKRMENSGFYFHVEPEKLLLGAGLYQIPKDLLKPFREAVASDQHSAKLLEIVKDLEKKGYAVGTEYYKKVPKGFDKDHKMEKYLRFNGLSVIAEFDLPKEIHSSEIIDISLEHYKNMMPLHKWLVDAL